MLCDFVKACLGMDIYNNNLKYSSTRKKFTVSQRKFFLAKHSKIPPENLTMNPQCILQKGRCIMFDHQSIIRMRASTYTHMNAYKQHLRFFFEEISGNSLQDRLLQRKKERKKRTVLMFSPHDISINKQKFYWWDLSYQNYHGGKQKSKKEDWKERQKSTCFFMCLFLLKNAGC